MINEINDLLISRSLDLSDYEIIIRQRGTYEYSAYSPQLNYMAKAKDLLTAKSLLVKRINQHIRHLMENPHLIEEYNQKMDAYRREHEEFIKANLQGGAKNQASGSINNAYHSAPPPLDGYLGVEQPFDSDFPQYGEFLDSSLGGNNLSDGDISDDGRLPYDENIDYSQLPETDEANKVDMNDIMDLFK